MICMDLMILDFNSKLQGNLIFFKPEKGKVVSPDLFSFYPQPPASCLYETLKKHFPKPEKLK